MIQFRDGNVIISVYLFLLGGSSICWIDYPLRRFKSWDRYSKNGNTVCRFSWSTTKENRYICLLVFWCVLLHKIFKNSVACLWYIYFFLSNVDRCYFCDLTREKYTHVWQTSWPALTWIFLSLGYWTLNFHLEQLKNPCLKCMVLTPSFPPLEYPHYADFLWLKYSCSWQLPATRYGMCHHRTIAAWWKFAYLWSCTWRNSKVVVTYRCSLSEKIGKPPCNHQDLSQKPIYC